MQKNSAIILIACSDRKGLVNAITDFISKYNGNIIDLEQHVDQHEKMFFMRIEWDLTNFKIKNDKIHQQFNNDVAKNLNMQWSLHFSERPVSMAIFVSKYSHCLFDILARYQSKEWGFKIPLVISNHPDLEKAVTPLGIDFHCIPVNKKNKKQAEAQQLDLLKQYKIDAIVLARYMQILSADLIQHYENKIINIHHSFLPAFPGAKPYHSAYERGVKIIGASSHYVTADLDAGPIIAQDVEPIRHTDTIEDLVRKGQDIEKIVLSKAIWAHINFKTLVYKNRTIVFE
ncbi:Formyltetrahydrofolate deformylase [hydrothermal vent metagenome]|uniref:Formyltetrahydrofolate deformylase n=1 Tax=hydrothermal vent metagenome TaxID=652676 RepID=A0A3B1AAJ7_9ZZZZ